MLRKAIKLTYRFLLAACRDHMKKQNAYSQNIPKKKKNIKTEEITTHTRLRRYLKPVNYFTFSSK